MTDFDDSAPPPRELGFLAPVLISIGILVLIGAAVFWFNPHKTAELSVLHVQTFAPHTEFSAPNGAIHILGQQNQSEDDLYVAASVKLDDKLRLPIFVSDVSASVTTANGAQVEAANISPTDWPRMMQIFPPLQPMLSQPLRDGSEALPGGSATGTVLLLFPGLTADDWAKKKSATLQIGLAHQDPITVALP